MFDKSDDMKLSAVLPYQVASFIFTATLASDGNHIRLLDYSERNHPLGSLDTEDALTDLFVPMKLPSAREYQELSAFSSLSSEAAEKLMGSVRRHPEEDEYDWMLYEIFKRKVRTLSFEEAVKITFLKLASVRGVVVNEGEEQGCRADVSVYALLKCTDGSGHMISPVVNIVVLIERMGAVSGNGSMPLLPVDFRYMRLKDGLGEELLQKRVIHMFNERFVERLAAALQAGPAPIPTRPLLGKTYKVFSSALDSFSRFSPDPLSSFAEGRRGGKEQVLVALYLLNLLFVDYDRFERAEEELYDPSFVEKRLRKVLTFNETSTVTYVAPGSTVTIDDYSDPDVRVHVAEALGGSGEEADHNLGGPRDEIAYHTLILSAVSSRNSVLNRYQNELMESLRTDGGTGAKFISNAARIRQVVEKAITEFSLNSLGMFQSAELEDEYEQILAANAGNDILVRFRQNVDFYGRYAVDEQQLRLISEQSAKLDEEKLVLNELRDVLRHINESNMRSERLTRVLILLSAASIIIALLLSIHLL